jgi:eukaryotic-like serine/threonine-protein kinase
MRRAAILVFLALAAGCTRSNPPTDAAPHPTVSAPSSSVPVTVDVPDVTGMENVDAKTAVRDVGLSVGITKKRAPNETPGTVLKQFPAPGTAVAAGSPVNLTVAVP